MNSIDLEKYIETTYCISAERPFKDDLETVVFRNSTSKKWFAIIMHVSQSRLGLNSEDKVYIINVKCSPLLVGSLVGDDGVYPAYHMNKKHWVSILIDRCPPDKLKILIDNSFELTTKKKRK